MSQIVPLCSGGIPSDSRWKGSCIELTAACTTRQIGQTGGGRALRGEDDWPLVIKSHAIIVESNTDFRNRSEVDGPE